MSLLLDLIDDYKDRHGQPSDASIARAIGVSPQTLSSWRRRGLRDFPETSTLERLADFIHVSRADVLLAAARDVGWDDGSASPPPPSRVENESGKKGHAV